MRKFGIDISVWQPPNSIDYDTLAKEVDFVILRAGFTGHNNGKDPRNFNIDRHFERHYSELSRRGVPIGVYWYGGAKTKAEADKEIELLMKAISGKKLAYPVYYDVEENLTHGKLSKQSLTEIVEYWCATVEAKGYYVGIYASLNWFRNKLDSDRLSRFDFWLAHWNVAAPAFPVNLWQFKDDGHLTAHKGNLDFNYSYADYPSMIKKAGLNGYGKDSTPNKPSNEVKPVSDKVVDEVLANKYGTGDARRKALKAAGYDPDAVQKAVNARLKGAKPAGKPTGKVKVGDRVEYSGHLYGDSFGGKRGAKVNGTFTVDIVNGNPYGIHLKGKGWVKPSTVKGASKASSGKIKAGDKVRVVNNIQYNGGRFAVYHDKYDVIEVRGDRVVIGIVKGGKREVTAAVNAANLKKA